MTSTTGTNKGTLYTISAPSGAGKTSLVAALIAQTTELKVSVSHTTRDSRPGEQDGVDYHFVSLPEFQTLRAADGFLEHAEVFGNWYGTSSQWVEDTLRDGSDVILEIDWQGARQICLRQPETLSIYILPPSREALRHRLTGRGQDDPATIDRRMQQATNEIAHYGDADYLIINDHFEQALYELQSIITSHRLRLASQRARHQQLLSTLIAT